MLLTPSRKAMLRGGPTPHLPPEGYGCRPCTTLKKIYLYYLKNQITPLSIVYCKKKKKKHSTLYLKNEKRIAHVQHFEIFCFLRQFNHDIVYLEGKKKIYLQLIL
jgi:hypothetical protein